MNSLSFNGIEADFVDGQSHWAVEGLAFLHTQGLSSRHVLLFTYIHTYVTSRAHEHFVRLSSQDPSLPGVSGFPDDHPEGPGEAGGLAAHLNHLHPQWHHWQLGLSHLPALQSRGDNEISAQKCHNAFMCHSDFLLIRFD